MSFTLLSRSILVLAAGLALGACAKQDAQTPLEDVADRVFINAQAYTQEAAQPWAEALAIKDGRFVYVGADAGVQALIGADTEVIDLAGSFVAPGFIDTHAHPVMAAGQSEAFFLDLNASIDDWLQVVAGIIAESPDKDMFMGMGFLAASFGPDGPTSAMLDAIESERPVILMDEGFHSAWMNSKAMELAGIDKNTPDPIPGFHYYQRDAEGNPTGWALEAMAFMPILMKLGMVSEETIAAGADKVFGMFSSFGITTVYDAGMSLYEPVAWPAAAKLDQEGKLPFRLIGSHMIQDHSQLAGAVDTLKNYQSRYGSERLQPRVMKIHNDGTKEAFTAAQFEDYNNQEGNKGGLLLAGKALQDFVLEVDQAGFDIHIHAIGDRAVAEALDAFEAARAANPESQNRYSTAHTELVRDEDLARFGELDVVAQTTPFWFATDGEMERMAVGDVRAAKLYRFRKILDAGGKVSFGSDFPATGDLMGLYPLLNVEMGMTRQYPGAADMPVTPPVDAKLTMAEMLRGYTLDAAYQLNMEADLGSLQVGKYADFVVLGANPFETQVYDLHKVPVLRTVVGGDTVFQAQ